MNKGDIVSKISRIVLPIAEKHGCELVDVEFVKEGSAWYLRVYIDKSGGVFIEDCQAVSEDLSDKMDETEVIHQSYYLEVSSPGLERPLKNENDFIKYAGEKVEVKLFSALNGKKIFQGKLVGIKENKVMVELEDGVLLEVEKEKTSYVKRVLTF